MKILIVDDETIIRQWFMLMVNDIGDNEYSVVGEASNGIDALNFCGNNDVDLIVTDIKMPVMDGIELVKKIKKTYPTVKSLILSSHSEFELAKAAIKYGASDYLLKAEITKEELLEVLKKVNTNIKNEAMSTRIKIKYQKIIFTETFNIRNRFLKEIVEGNINALTDFNLKSNYLDIKIDSNKINVMAFWVNEMNEADNVAFIKEKSLLSYSIINIAEEIEKSQLKSVCVFHLSEGQFIFLYNDDNNSQLNARNHMITIAKELTEALKKYLNINITTGGTIETCTLELLNISINRAINAQNINRFYNVKELRFWTSIKLIHENSIEKLLEYELSLTEYNDNPKEFENRILNDIKKALNEQSCSPESIISFCSSFAVLVKSYLLSMSIPYNMIVATEKLISLDQTKILNADILLSLVKEMLVECHTLIANINAQYSEPIKAIIEFIGEHYKSEITLIEMADYVNLNSSYLSVLFKKETGENMSEFLTKYRINKAKKLLRSTNSSFSEVAEMVGYANASYFTRVFKKQMGFSPSEFKKKLKKTQE